MFFVIEKFAKNHELKNLLRVKNINLALKNK